jgi:hypothetical protein
MAYGCAQLSDVGQCLQWVELSSEVERVTQTQVWDSFVMGFAVIFATWSIGFTVSVVASMVRKITV